MEDPLDLPYRAEYSKSDRASCKGCKTKIPKEVVRIARMVKSSFHDGKQPNWFHEKCFFKKFQPSSIDEIANAELLRYEDQERLKKSLGSGTSTVVIKPSTSGKGKKRKNEDGAGEVQMTAKALKDFGIEVSSTSRATCHGCQQLILKGQVRAKKIVYDTEVGMKFGGQPLWHHFDCFAKLRMELGWYSGANQLPGFKGLPKDEQAKATKEMPAVSAGEIENVKKMKIEPKQEVDEELEKKLMQQNKVYHKHRDYLKGNLKKNEMIEILEKNKQEIPSGNDAVLEATTDIITFGALLPCSECKGQFVFIKSNYICTGNISEWLRCEKKTTEPARTKTKIPTHIIEAHPDIPKMKQVVVRALKYIPPSVSNVKVKKEEGNEPKISRPKPPLHMMKLVVTGKTTKSRDELKKIIQSLGGKMESQVNEQTIAVISTEKEMKKMDYKMEAAKKHGIQVVPENFLDDVQEPGADVIQLIKTTSLCDWGTDPSLRIQKEEDNKSKSKSIYTKSVPKSMKLQLKDGTAVDPDSGLQHSTHVYVQGDTKYFAILCKIDIQRDKNSFYKIQLLEGDNFKRYYVFRAWGRIGTKIGGNKTETFHDVNEAIYDFQRLYEEQTGNVFGTKNFRKLPDRYYPIEVDYGDEQIKKLSVESTIKSKLEPAVQDLIKIMFDVNAMKRVMLDFDLDMTRMPLGKLSQKQLTEAMKVLSEISEFIRTGADQSKFIGKSNQFYTLVPHDFGVERPTIIDSAELVQTKTEMIEALMEIEIAYGMLKIDDAHSDVNSLDAYYEKLKADIKTLGHDDDEFKLLEKYVKNTHAQTHSNYELDVQEIYKVVRQGETRRYKPFKKLHNRKLLWHGSRVTNFVGILSHGLKIAPPEAPVTGYMFGKGIYFADMVSKSANYCSTNVTNPTGLMLICEVALGDMHELPQAQYITQLPKDKHSTKGVGKTYPDPKQSHLRKDGVEIPYGKPITNTKVNSALLYNEYIVYDVAQVNIQYLLKMDFKYKY